jgi:hypothetical protein
MKQQYLNILLFFISTATFAQRDSTKMPLHSRWQFFTSTGVYADLFNASILTPKQIEPNSFYIDAISYSDKKAHYVNLGIISRFELMYHFNSKSAVSFAFNKASWRTIYGKGSDPLEVFKDYRDYQRRIQFSGNYYRSYKVSKRATLQPGIGFMIQVQQFNNTFYEYDFSNDSIFFPEQGVSNFSDPVLALNLHYLYRINKSLSVGADFFTGYTYQIGIENAAIMGTLALDLNSILKEIKK